MFFPVKEPFTVKLGRFIGNAIALLVSAFIMLLLIVIMGKLLMLFI